MEAFIARAVDLLFTHGGLLGVAVVVEGIVIWLLSRALRDSNLALLTVQAARVEEAKATTTEVVRALQSAAAASATLAVTLDGHTRAIEARSRSQDSVAATVESFDRALGTMADDMRDLRRDLTGARA